MQTIDDRALPALTLGELRAALADIDAPEDTPVRMATAETGDPEFWVVVRVDGDAAILADIDADDGPRYVQLAARAETDAEHDEL